MNTKYKDSLFSWLFSDPDTLRELYSAIAGIPLDPAAPVTINTLEGVLYMDMMTDISFVIAGKLVFLLEHQSTINPNMAIRLLMYIGRVYEKIIGSKNIYSTKKLIIPQPEFIVLYNGTAPYPDKSILKLSDSWNHGTEQSAASLGLVKSSPPALELAVTVYNINHGRNAGIVQRCRRLSGYSAFVAKVRECEKTAPDKESAMKAAVQYCIKNDILKEILEAHASEVVNMLLTEWNLDDAKEVWREEGREEGLKEGEEKGEKKMLHEVLELLKQGYQADQIEAALSAK